MNQDDIYANLTQLGSRTALPSSPEEAVLERFANTQAGVDYCVRFTAPENGRLQARRCRPL